RPSRRMMFVAGDIEAVLTTASTPSVASASVIRRWTSPKRMSAGLGGAGGLRRGRRRGAALEGRGNIRGRCPVRLGTVGPIARGRPERGALGGALRAALGRGRLDEREEAEHRIRAGAAVGPRGGARAGEDGDGIAPLEV